MNGDDVRVIEVGDSAGFGQVGFGGFGPIHQLSMRHLDGDEPLQLPVMSEVDEAEAALSADFLDPVATDVRRRAGKQHQRRALRGRPAGKHLFYRDRSRLMTLIAIKCPSLRQLYRIRLKRGIFGPSHLSLWARRSDTAKHRTRDLLASVDETDARKNALL